MNRIGMLVVCGALLLVGTRTASAAPQPTFETCESAYNYGSNTAKFVVSAAFNRASCNPDKIKTSKDSLATSLRKQKIPTHNTDELKTCFYQGLYAGYIVTLADELGDCGNWLDLGTVAQAALSIFVAMHNGLEGLDGFEVNQVFDGVYDATGQDGNACASYLLDQADYLDVDLSDVVESVCWND